MASLANEKNQKEPDPDLREVFGLIGLAMTCDPQNEC
jgi:hypothetical protein